MKPSRHIQFKLLIIMIVLSIFTLALILIPTVQFGRNALKQQALEKMDLSLELIQIDLEKNIEEAEKIVRKLKMATEDYFHRESPETLDDYEMFLDAMDDIVEIEAQNHRQSLTAYIYIDPERFNEPLDIYYADQTGDGKVTRQMRIPVDYFMEGPTIEDDKSWWFGPIENQAPFWSLPYDWTLDNGTVIRFISYTVPIYYGEDFIGVVGTDINYHFLIDKIQSFQILETGVAFLLDEKANIIFSPDLANDVDDQWFVTREISNGWVVGISVLESEVYSPIVAFNNRIIVSVLITFGLASLLSLVFSQSITRPLMALVDAFEQSKNKQNVVNLPINLMSRTDEIGILSNVLSNYSASLLKTKDQLTLFEQALDHGDNGFFMLSADYEVIYANKTFLALTNQLKFSKLPLDNYGIVVSIDHRKQLDTKGELKVEKYLNSSSGEKILINLYISKLNSTLAYGFGIIKDMTQIRLRELQFNEAKNYDPLTLLLNRSYFLTLSNQVLEGVPQLIHACLLINIDNFRLLNGILGVTICNKLLEEVAKRLQMNLPNMALIGRSDGDEFVVLVPYSDEKFSNIHAYIDNIKSLLGEPIFIDEEQIFITYSMGYALYPHDGATIYQLLKKSNIALTQAKAYGKNQLFRYENTGEDKDEVNLQLYKNLRFAVKKDEFFLMFQPQVDVQTSKVIGVEVLLRWLSQGQLISPAEFIPIAEQSRLIIPIGEFVLNKSFEFAHVFHKNYPDLLISINLSVEQLRFNIVVKQVEKLLDLYDVKPNLLVFEVTEGLLITSNEEAILVIKALKKMGFHIALDDFGMGYSSLNYLKNVPFDIIKMDRVFIKDYPETDNGSIAALIVHLGNDLNVKIVAEGVETKLQKDFLASQGCKIIQGFYYSKPLKENELMKYLE